MNALPFGLFGFGQHASKVVLPAFSEVSCAELRAIGTSHVENVKKLIESQDRDYLLGSYPEVLVNSSLDAIYICLPNHLHFKWARQALLSGKHVLCEKPLCLTLADAEELNSIAKTKNLKLHEGFMYRFHPQMTELRRLLEQNILGNILSVSGHYHYSLTDSNNIRLRKDTAGGALHDAGCYLIDVFSFLFGPAEVEKAEQQKNSDLVDTRTKFSLRANRLNNTLFGHFSASMCDPQDQRLEISGSLGKLTLKTPSHIPRKKEVLIEFSSSSGEKTITKIPPANHFALQIEAFSRWVLGEMRPFEMSDGLNNARIIENIRNQNDS